MSFQPGYYYLINVKHAADIFKNIDNLQNAAQNAQEVGQQVAAIDLSGGDEQSVIAFGWHGGDNQKWKFEDSGNGLYHIQNVKYGKYLTFPDEPNDGKQVIATDGPREWEVRVGREGENQKDQHESIRIFVPGTNQNLDLTNHGDITPGNPVQLWARTPGKGQAWYAIPAPPS